MVNASKLVHPHAWVSPGAELGEKVMVGAGSVVHDGVKIGDGTIVHEHCVLGTEGPGGPAALSIGPESIIRSHSVIYGGSELGPRLECGHHIVIRENTRSGINLRVGNFCDIEGDCTIGDFCRFHGYVHVGKGSRIGHFVWLFSLTTATNDPLPPSLLQEPVTIEDGAVVCVGVTIMPGTHIGMGAMVSAGACASGCIPAGAVVAGADGRIVNHVGRLMHLSSGTRHPWMRHYHKGFPPEVVSRLELLEKTINETRFTLKIVEA